MRSTLRDVRDSPKAAHRTVHSREPALHAVGGRAAVLPGGANGEAPVPSCGCVKPLTVVPPLPADQPATSSRAIRTSAAQPVSERRHAVATLELHGEMTGILETNRDRNLQHGLIGGKQ